MKGVELKIRLFNRSEAEQRWRLCLSRRSRERPDVEKEVALAAQQSCTTSLPRNGSDARLEVSCSGFEGTQVDLATNTNEVSCVAGGSSRRIAAIFPSERRGPDSKNGIRKLQVGCGPHNLFPDWWNVDVRSFPGVDAVFDATRAWPYTNLRYIYGEHFLEHLDLDQAITFLISAGKSLEPGGVLRLTTPNLEWVMRTHYRFATDPAAALIDTLRTNRAFHGWGHRFLYSKAMVTSLCSCIGFERVAFFDYGQSPHEELRNLERHGKWRRDENGLVNHLIFELSPGPQLRLPSEIMPLLEKEFLNAFRGGH